MLVVFWDITATICIIQTHLMKLQQQFIHSMILSKIKPVNEMNFLHYKQKTTSKIRIGIKKLVTKNIIKNFQIDNDSVN